MVQRFIDTHFQRSAVRLTISCALIEGFHVSGIQPHPTTICFISHLLKNFQNSSSFNEPDSSCHCILSPSMPIEAISDSSELVIFNSLCKSNYWFRPSKGNLIVFPQCYFIRKKLEALKKDRLINIITLHNWYLWGFSLTVKMCCIIDCVTFWWIRSVNL